MTVFKIDACRITQLREVAEFEVHLREGTVEVGDTFVCYDTHLPVEFRVLATSSNAVKALLTCAGWLGFDEQFSGAVVNTAASKRPEAFRYEPATKPA